MAAFSPRARASSESVASSSTPSAPTAAALEPKRHSISGGSTSSHRMPSASFFKRAVHDPLPPFPSVREEISHFAWESWPRDRSSPSACTPDGEMDEPTRLLAHLDSLLRSQGLSMRRHLDVGDVRALVDREALEAALWSAEAARAPDTECRLFGLPLRQAHIHASAPAHIDGMRHDLPLAVFACVERLSRDCISDSDLFRSLPCRDNLLSLIDTFDCPHTPASNVFLADIATCLEDEPTEDVCALLTTYLVQLPTPVLEPVLWDAILVWCVQPLAPVAQGTRIAIARTLLRLLPRTSLSLIAYLLTFFAKALDHPQNNLTPEYIASTFAGAIFGVPPSSSASAAPASESMMRWFLTHWADIHTSLWEEGTPVGSGTWAVTSVPLASPSASAAVFSWNPDTPPSDSYFPPQPDTPPQSTTPTQRAAPTWTQPAQPAEDITLKPTRPLARSSSSFPVTPDDFPMSYYFTTRPRRDSDASALSDSTIRSATSAMEFSFGPSLHDPAKVASKDTHLWRRASPLGRPQSRPSSPATSDEGDEVDDGASVDSASVYSAISPTHSTAELDSTTIRYEHGWDIPLAQKTSASAFSSGNESSELAYMAWDSPQVLDDAGSVYGGYEEVRRVEEVLIENEELRQRVKELERERDEAVNLVRQLRLRGV